MDRKQLSDELVKNIYSNSTPDQVAQQAQLVLSKVESYFKETFPLGGFEELQFLQMNVTDLTDTIVAIAEYRFYDAVTHIRDLLLKVKAYDTPLGIYELFITRSCLEGMIKISENPTWKWQMIYETRISR